MVSTLALESGKVFIHYIILPSCILLLLLAMIQGIYNRYLHSLSGIPGPFWASVTKLYLAYNISSVPIKGLQLHQKYGEHALLERQFLISADVLRKVLSCGSRPTSYLLAIPNSFPWCTTNEPTKHLSTAAGCLATRQRCSRPCCTRHMLGKNGL